jgi:hypothetical protein
MIPMHLGLIDRPFVPNHLISAQESPVPLPNFQMASRLKILMSSGFKKGTQIYYPCLPSSGKQIPSRFPNGAPMDRDTHLTGHFYISLDISLYLICPKKTASLCVPQKQDPYENRCPFQSFQR